MKKLKIILQSNWFYILLFFLFLFYFVIKQQQDTKLDINTSSFQGIIEHYEVGDSKLQLQIKGKDKILATYYLKDEQEKNYLKDNLVLGSKITIIGSFQVPTKNTIPNNFNYQKYLKSKKINLVMNIDSYELTKKCNIFYKIKNKIIKQIEKRKNKSYFYTFILGNKDYMNKDVYKSYQTNSITHLFAISGMHISMLILILKKLNIKKIGIYILLFFYSFLVLFSPSVLRVTLFYILKNNSLFKEVSNVKILYLTAFLLLIFNPFLIYDVGFQYTFIITLGLFILKPKNFLALSIEAFFLSLPITILNSFEFNLLSILINILIVPFVSFILYPFLLLTFIFPILEPILTILLFILEQCNLLFSKLAIIIVVGKFKIIFLIVYYFLLYLFSKTKQKRIIFILFLILIINKYSYRLSSSYSLYFLDVEQGDCSVLFTPRLHEVIMIDTGGKVSYQNQEKESNLISYQSNQLISFLKSYGITHLDYLILTHGDYDHMGNSIDLAKYFKIKNVIFNHDEFNELENKLIQELDKMNIKYNKNINVLDICNNKLYFLNNKFYDNENDNSNVIYTELNGIKLLLMGDAGVEIEENIINNYNLNKIDILKVGHHGSKTSSSKIFIDNINSKYSIISVGKNNRYGHPNNEVLKNLEDSKIYRTDQDGSIMFKIKNNRLEIEICTP